MIEFLKLATMTKAGSLRSTEKFLRISDGTITASNGFVFATAPFADCGNMFVCPHAERFLAALEMCGDNPVKYTLDENSGNLKIQSVGFSTVVPCLADKYAFAVVTNTGEPKRVEPGMWPKIRAAMKKALNFVGVGPVPEDNVTCSSLLLANGTIQAVSPALMAEVFVSNQPTGLHGICIPTGIVSLLIKADGDVSSVAINHNHLQTYMFENGCALTVQGYDPIDYISTEMFYENFNPNTMVPMTEELSNAVKKMAAFSTDDNNHAILFSAEGVKDFNESTQLSFPCALRGAYSQKFFSLIIDHITALEPEPATIDSGRRRVMRWMGKSVRGVLAPVIITEEKEARW